MKREKECLVKKQSFVKLRCLEFCPVPRQDSYPFGQNTSTQTGGNALLNKKCNGPGDPTLTCVEKNHLFLKAITDKKPIVHYASRGY